MSTWTDIILSRVAAGAPPSTSLMTAFRNNILAALAGASGAPKVSPAAMGVLIFADSATVTAPDTTTLTSDGDLTRVDNVIIMANLGTSSSGGSPATGDYEYRLSDDGGSTWGSWNTIGESQTNDTFLGATRPHIAMIDTSAHDTIQTRLDAGGDSGADTATVSAYCIGVQGEI